MQAVSAYVVGDDQLAMQPIPNGNGMFRVPIDRSVGCQNLIQRVFRYGMGRSPIMCNETSEDISYVVSGRGEALVNGTAQPLAPATGLFIPPGALYEIVNPGPDDLLIVSVLSPQPGYELAWQVDASLRSDGRLITTEAEETPLPAGDRTFKLMINHRYGCRNVTQFVGFIPPGKAPFHSHTYEEVIYFVEGAGIAHVDDRDYPIKAGSSVYLPPLYKHCLENTGDKPIRLLGVFCPAGDPSSKAAEDKP